MLNLFKKEIQICSPVAGRTQNIESVNDPMFSQKMMGDGIAISPSEGKFYAVESGVLSAFFPTMHAYGITCDNGVEILVHLGIDTVNANGNGFTSIKKQGDRIEKGDLIITVDLDNLKQTYDMTTMVVITNLNNKTIIKKNIDQNVTHSDTILTLK